MEIKLSIGDPKTKKCYNKAVSEQNAKFFVGKKIGDTFKGESIDFTGYEFEITGGSDNCGFPMRRDVPGGMRRRILITKSSGLKSKRKGHRKRKTVAGNTIHDMTAQVNLKILKHGKKSLEEAEPSEAPAEEKAPAIEAPKPEEKPEAKEEKQAEEKKSLNGV
ncbi:30S ribosomal protein S6e [Candidatus Woesearchaeota archaeon]|nr:30S ribosomal protein S6e [Candidatus Woesearchaeota archaeon]